MIDRIQTWLDARPCVRFVGTLLAGFMYLWLIVFRFATLGVCVAAVSILVLNLASSDPIWVGWAEYLLPSAITGAGIGLFALMYKAHTEGPVRLARAAVAHDLVAQAVVAQRIGAERIDLRMGIPSGGRVGWSLPAALINEPLTADGAFERLTVLLANPLANDDRWSGRRRSSRFEEVSSVTDEILIRDAVHGVTAVSAAELIEGAARRARMLLDEVDDEVIAAIEAELLCAGRIRERRFLELLGAGEASRAGAEVLF